MMRAATKDSIFTNDSLLMICVTGAGVEVRKKLIQIGTLETGKMETAFPLAPAEKRRE